MEGTEAPSCPSSASLKSAHCKLILLASVTVVVSLGVATENLNRFLPAVALVGTTTTVINASENPSSMSIATLVDSPTHQQLEPALASQILESSTIFGTDGGSSLCRRSCPYGYINKIVSTDMKSSRGLGDRGIALLGLANLGGYLCATVEFPRPYIALHPAHNYGHRVHRDVIWSDYFDIAFATTTNSTISKSLHVVSELDYPHHKQRRRSSSDYTFFRTTSLDRVQEDFAAVEALSWNGTPNLTSESRPFLWEIQTEWYKTRRRLLGLLLSRFANDNDNGTISEPIRIPVSVGRSLSIQESRQRGLHMLPALKAPITLIKETGIRFCEYAKISAPHAMQRMADAILDELELHRETSRDTIVGKLHVRRTDSVNSCNTSLPKMESYLKCTFPSSSPSRNILLLFASDDFTPAYRRGFENLVNQNLEDVAFVDLDYLIQNYTKQAIAAGQIPSRNLNNFYIFKLGNVLSRNTSFDFQQHREHCPDCDEI